MASAATTPSPKLYVSTAGVAWQLIAATVQNRGKAA
jgi:hypothetical protein